MDYSSQPIYAALDLGSNSFHLLVVRVEEENYMAILDNLKESVRLGAGLDEEDALTPAAQKRALECLLRFSQRLRGIPAEHIRIVGTNTLRRAKNARNFLQKVHAILPVPVHVLGGSEEARLIYLGVTHYLAPSENRNLVIDIGGGSTELIIGRNQHPTERESLSMGCVSYSLSYFDNGLVSERGFHKAVLSVAQKIEVYSQRFGPTQWDRAIGASGTIKAIAGIHQALGYQGDFITYAGMQEIKARLIRAKSVSQAKLPNLRDDRLPVFAGGFAVLYGLFKELGIQEVRVSPHALREGVLLDLLGRKRNQDKRQETVTRLQAFYGVDLAHARRVQQTALGFFPAISQHLTHPQDMARDILGWAADLHEIGLAIAHHGYHKHGAYILLNGDLDGFSQSEQGLLSFLVLNQRKRLKQNLTPYANQFEWPLVFLLRLSQILHRERREFSLPHISISWQFKEISLQIDPAWLKDHPLTEFDLNLEKTYWKRIGIKINLNLTK